MAKKASTNKKVKIKEKTEVNIMPTCIMANIVTIFYLGYAIFMYKQYGHAGVNDIPFAIFLVVVAGFATGIAKYRNDKKNKFM